MKYAVLFTGLGTAVCAWAAINGGWTWLAVWPGATYIAVGIIYALRGHGFWSKGPSGSISHTRLAMLAPYPLALWLIWHGHRLRSKEPVCNLVIAGNEVGGPVWLGRWPFQHELPAGTNLVVDLLAEWPARRGVAEGRVYRSFPILDGCAPGNRERFVELVDEVASNRGISYVHCAMGHGRSGLFAAAVLIRRGLAANAQDAVATIQLARPRVRLNRSQMDFLHTLNSALPSNAKPSD
jgi:hypothetical protein